MGKYSWYMVKKVLETFDGVTVSWTYEGQMKFHSPAGQATIPKSNNIKIEIVRWLLHCIGVSVDEFDKRYNAATKSM